MGGSGHEKAERFVARRLQEIGCKAYRGQDFALPYEVENQKFCNFAGIIPGRDRSLPPLLIGAHYDSVIPHPCADDNGAAVAICFALAEIVEQAGGLQRDLLVTIFDAEEPPHFQGVSMGSNRFYEDQLDGRGVQAAVVFDLVGHDLSLPVGLLSSQGMTEGTDAFLADIAGLLFMTGTESHPDLAGIVEGSEVPDGLGLAATLNDYVGDMSDHGVFRRNGVPYLFFSCGRWAHYHMPTDTPDRLNYQKMARITKLVATLLPQMAEAALAESPIEPDTLGFEIRSLEKSFGLLLKPLLQLAGQSRLESREDVGRFVGCLLNLGL